MKKLRVTVDGKVYDVLVEMLDDASGPAPASPRTAAVAAPAAAPAVPTPTPIPSLLPAAAPTPAAGAGSVGSPLAGKVISIDVRVGDAVAEGAQLVTLEAMKMNTFVYAPHAGRVTAVHTAAGEAVEEGAALISLG